MDRGLQEQARRILTACTSQQCSWAEVSSLEGTQKWQLLDSPMKRSMRAEKAANEAQPAEREGMRKAREDVAAALPMQPRAASRGRRQIAMPAPCIRRWLAYAHGLGAARVRQDGPRGAAGVDGVACVVLGSVRLDQALAARKERAHRGKALGVRPGTRDGQSQARQ